MEGAAPFRETAMAAALVAPTPVGWGYQVFSFPRFLPVYTTAAPSNRARPPAV